MLNNYLQQEYCELLLRIDYIFDLDLVIPLSDYTTMVLATHHRDVLRRCN